MADIREVVFGSEEYRGLIGLRYEVLRKPLGLVVSMHDVAMEDREIHIGAFKGPQVVGCVLLRPIGMEVVKLRQMAVADECQGKGLGAKIVAYGEELAQSRGFRIMETHARVVAQGFYEKMGYVARGEKFVEVTVETIFMSKVL